MIPPRPQRLVHRYGPATADRQLWKSLQARFSLPSRFWLAGNSNRRDRIEKLPVLSHVAVSTQRHEIRERVVPLLAPFDLVMDLQIFQRSALLTPPSVPLQHPLHQSPIDLPSEFDRLDFFQHLAALSNSSSRSSPARRAWYSGGSSMIR